MAVVEDIFCHIKAPERGSKLQKLNYEKLATYICTDKWVKFFNVGLLFWF